ncbi:hypothetical protein E1178_08990 [Roseibium hamelinense]|nr:hypothetical protein [Roseibium hamelinense]MTI43745.1 hypothetical protein [Roseibium hamelinense]
MTEKKKSLAFCAIDSKGSRDDALIHAELLNDADFETFASMRAISDYVERGGSLQHALTLFATDEIHDAAQGAQSLATLEARMKH